ncbi:UDP-N-acetylglucosamine 2-epimerase (non-hydrolyzing) [Kocuria rhizophila]|uniref:UDP-N-acetylglucosamine 2-epimerase (non-hydrolyzing) n=1 Tax=Kocuria rhizophila TaxID=72000 RepID=A0AAX2SFU8_KOCRH|nr:UDP-N-acetylglucosamine 2-epimerase (non-hydrolyzing) [Kocuria rhizophila]MCT1916242.1 UDP-N-acetylglucosamine 2-epimerase (non-hydrolyzing) [Kocuria rhizophila]MCT1957199.1 UDP-N-acetylglucosamine 2-epimerase (non-hydrolyzing) [Kocuria rhizophila]MCT2073658.1 UDP-N-acetylglucosamine 2-epimerase (non-hydrolyzing) [Kocuria rhizophila]PMR91565.1 UDP-N-acetylglucosamine 2-epimerase (non-hydrolyzing) [Kocuria rhizophila]RLP61105.1 UDP-N-acetylglucosamine 2-epimerase (non-hydrolyzing) [Kocuria r
MFTIMPIYGTRPEAIKMAPIVKALQASPQFECVVTVTGQHREMLDQVNEIFDITPDHDLNIIQPRQTLNGVLTRTVEGLDAIFAENAPDAVVVQGDTTTSTAGAIAAFYRGIPVIHAEAGLRSFDLFSPFPEEANRKMTSQITSLHLAPTSTSKENLLREALPEEDIVVTGNTVIDALLHTVEQKLPFSDPQLEEIASSGRRVLLVTTHRRENQGEAMRGVGRALARIAQAEPELTIVLPVHRNPVVREAVLPAIEGLPNVVVTEPLAYGEFTRMLSVAHVVLTDSGGVQEEAPSLGKPVLVMRENTERPEAVTAGTVTLIGTDEERIVTEVDRLLNDDAAYRAMANAVNPYGDGRAAERTLAAIEQMFGVGQRIADFDSQA